jgi:hypothetical protein
VRRVPRSPIDQAHADEAERRRRLPAKWLAAVLITAAVGLLAPGMTYITAGRSSTTTATTTAATTAATTATTTAATTVNTATAGCRGVTQAILPASGFITNPSRAQGGHLWWRRSADGGSVCIGTVIMWVQYNTTAAKTWQVTIYSARHPDGLIVASRTFSLKRGWYWWGFGVHQYYQGLNAVCLSATESFGSSCVDFSAPAG